MSMYRRRRPKKSAPAPAPARTAPTTYEFPVPEREVVLAHLTERGAPLALETLAQELGVSGERDLTAFRRRLQAMERDGQLHRNRRGLYGLINKMDLVRGRVCGHADGYGFLIPEEGMGDLFLSPREMRQVLHGDRIVAQVIGVDARGRREGRIVEVLERPERRVVGRYYRDDHLSHVTPDDRRLNQDILIPAGAEGAAAHGQIVVAEISEPPSAHRPPLGRVIEVLGDHMAPGMEIEIALRKYELPHVWPEAVEREAARLPAAVPEADTKGRIDLRALPLVTIDGEDARDFDDAVYCERNGRGWRLLVAIADVSHYVKPGTALDREAYTRGNSVYFPNHVIPMLPEALSNGLCSLNPEVDRLCMVCDMDITARGEIKDYRFYAAAMRSHARLTYNEVAAMLVAGDEPLRRRYAPLLPALSELYALYQVLRQARMARGAVDLDLPETRFVFDAQRKIERIVPLVRNDAHKLIEECMLAANVCAAALLTAHEVPALYRIHEGPTLEKLMDLRRFLSELGLSLGGGEKPGSGDYAKLLVQAQGRPDLGLIQTVLLRSLSQAIYSPDNVGHFALGYVNYTHFTSPIRRYPDLLVHRAIKAILARAPVADAAAGLAHTSAAADHCSITERRADEATRDVNSWLKAEFMLDKVGEEFDGIITGVASFGFFVALEDIFVEGMVHVTALGNDYYHFDPARFRLSGERTRVTYRLGDHVRVRVVRVDLDAAKIDFELAAPAEAKRGRRRAR